MASLLVVKVMMYGWQKINLLTGFIHWKGGLSDEIPSVVIHIPRSPGAFNKNSSYSKKMSKIKIIIF